LTAGLSDNTTPLDNNTASLPPILSTFTSHNANLPIHLYTYILTLMNHPHPLSADQTHSLKPIPTHHPDEHAFIQLPPRKKPKSAFQIRSRRM